MLNYIAYTWSKYSQPGKPIFIIDATFKGFSQVMFQRNTLTGICFFIALIISSYQVALASIVATFIATIFGLLVLRKNNEVADGLYGYNACLVGAALPTFLSNSLTLWLLIISGSIISTLIELLLTNFLKNWKSAVFTAPFVFTTWLMLEISHLYGHFRYLNIPLPPSGTKFIYLLNATLHGISQVFLCNTLITGILILLGLIISSKRVALIAFLSSMFAISIALLQGDNTQQIASGLYGFSAVLTGLALDNISPKKYWKNITYILMAIVLTVALQRILNEELREFSLPALTMPFVSICWIFLLLENIFLKIKLG